MKATLVIVGVLVLFQACFAEKFEPESNSELINYEQRLFEGMINDSINAIIAKIAPFDPLHIDNKQIELLGHQAEVNNVQAQGFSNVAATHISLGGFVTWTLELVIEAPLITASVDHWKAVGDVAFGEGAASLKVEKFKLSVTAKINPITQYVKSLRATPSIGHADVSITGIKNDEALSQEVSDKINNFLNDVVNNDKDLHDKLSNALLEMLRSVLGFY